MELFQIYQCLCETTRLRIVHLLTHGPLCVCHFQELLEVPQVKVSQQLAYLRKHGMVTATRHANWMIYALPNKRTPGLETNLKCLQDCAQTDKRFRADLQRLRQMKKKSRWVTEALEGKCCPPAELPHSVSAAKPSLNKTRFTPTRLPLEIP